MLYTRFSLIIYFAHSSVYMSVSISHSFHPPFQKQRQRYREETRKVKVKVTQSYPTHCDPYSPWNSPGQNTGVGSLSLLQGIFPTQGSNLGLPHCRQIFYQLSHKGLLRVLWTARRSNQSIPKEISPEYSLEIQNSLETTILWPPDMKN